MRKEKDPQDEDVVMVLQQGKNGHSFLCQRIKYVSIAANQATLRIFKTKQRTRSKNNLRM